MCSRVHGNRSIGSNSVRLLAGVTQSFRQLHLLLRGIAGFELRVCRVNQYYICDDSSVKRSADVRFRAARAQHLCCRSRWP